MKKDEIKGPLQNKLNELVQRTVWEKMLCTEPVWGVENARTLEDFNSALGSLIGKSIPDEEWTESLIRAVFDTGISFLQWKERLVLWYLTQDCVRVYDYDVSRPEQSYIRAFRFCAKLIRYTTSELSPFNKAIKVTPSLYWISYEYQKAVADVFNWFNEHFSKKGSPYSESSWDCLASLIRRIVQVGDWKYLEAIQMLRLKHESGVMKSNANDPFFADEVLAFLGKAVSLLEKAKEEQEGALKKFEEAVKEQVSREGKCLVKVCHPPLVVLKGPPSRVQVLVQLLWEDTSANANEVLPWLMVTESQQVRSCCGVGFEVEGSGNSSYVSLENGHQTFSFVPLLGRQRFWLTFRILHKQRGVIEFRSAHYLTVTPAEEGAVGKKVASS